MIGYDDGDDDTDDEVTTTAFIPRGLVYQRG